MKSNKQKTSLATCGLVLKLDREVKLDRPLPLVSQRQPIFPNIFSPKHLEQSLFFQIWWSAKEGKFPQIFSLCVCFVSNCLLQYLTKKIRSGNEQMRARRKLLKWRAKPLSCFLFVLILLCL